MDLQEILKATGMTVGDIRGRNIKLNGEDLENTRIDIGDISEVHEIGKFIDRIDKKWKNLILLVGLDNLMSGQSNIQNDLTELLKDWYFLRTSATEAFFLKRGIADERGILLNLEGQKVEYKKIEEPKRSHSIDIEKLKSDLEAVNKQLSNQAFVNKAPEFKVKAARERKERLERQIADAMNSNESILRFKDFN